MVHLLDSIEDIPSGLTGIVNTYGEPDYYGLGDEESFRQKHIEVFELPDPVVLRLSWMDGYIVSRIAAHRLVGPAIVDALHAIWTMFGADYLEANRLNLFGGIYNPRLKRGSNQLSTHTWGIAIDLNPHLWRYGQGPTQSNEDWRVFNTAFTVRGFVSGNEFPKPDPMHWQAAENY
jgi:hypothetical protein